MEHSSQSTIGIFDGNISGFYSKSPAPKLYQYHPLGQADIRVVDILGGADDDPIMINVRHVQLKDNLGSGFIALSYTWGDPHDIQLVHCRDGGGSIVVTRECLSALRRIRLPNKLQTFWVDAICINQRNVSERNYQVTLMSQIYQFSTKVVIYLGPNADDSEHILEYLCPSVHNPLALANMSPRQMDALRSLMSRPWFTRIWVIQEARNAKVAEVLCGDKSYPWSAFIYRPWGEHFFAENFLGPIPYVLLPPSFSWKQREFAYNKDAFSPSRLYEHLINARKCHSSDPRDKLFALLPLFEDAHSSLVEAELTPDYSKSAEDIFFHLGKYLLEGVGWPLLYAVESGSLLSLPSWCPDWSMTPSTPILYSFDRIHRVAQSLGANSNKIHGESSPKILPDGLLQLRGARYATIVEIGQACDLNNPMWPEVAYKEWRRLMLHTIALDDTNQELSEEGHDRPTEQLSEDEHSFLDHIFTFMSDFPHDGGIARSDDIRLKTMNAYRDNLEIWYREKHDRIKNRCQGQRIFVTSTTRIGLGSVHTQVGDVIVCLMHATVPFILREMTEGRYALIGKCELQGFQSQDYIRELSEGAFQEFLLV